MTLKTTLPASPREVFEAWLSSEGHTAMTGSTAHVEPAIGGSYDAYDGYIWGITLELDPFRRILQTWRTKHFESNDPDSMIEIILEAAGDSTLLTLIHTDVPDKLSNHQETGWKQFYFGPMTPFRMAAPYSGPLH